MKAADIRSDLMQKIDAMNVTQLKEFYGVLQNYFNGATDEWSQMTEYQKRKINEGIGQADGGLTQPLSEVTSRLRRKYGLNN